MKRHTSNQRNSTRQATILICVLVCLAIATALVTSTVRTALHARRAMQTQLHVRQAEFLLAAGVQRAGRALRIDTEYLGETWHLLPQAIPGIEAAEVKIEIAPAADPSPRKASVTARLSVTAHTVLQRSTSFFTDSLQRSDQE